MGLGLGLSLGWAPQELGLGVRCCPVWGRCPPGPWPDMSMSAALGAAAAEEIKVPREQGRVRVHENHQDFIPLVTVEAPPGLLTRGREGAGPGGCPSSHALCTWARLEAGIAREDGGGGRPGASPGFF